MAASVDGGASLVHRMWAAAVGEYVCLIPTDTTAKIIFWSAQTSAPVVWRAMDNGECGFEVSKRFACSGALVTLADFDTVFKTEERFKQALPDPASMAGWTPQDASARIEEEPGSAERCGPDTDWECARIARGAANFEAAGEEAHFAITAFADRKAAQDACRKEKDWSAKYTKAQVPPRCPAPRATPTTATSGERTGSSSPCARARSSPR
ncbi:hypothetical protein [Streptomyces sp. NPDC002057]|uniref:hypothetical protein n=1 Tax=Streptomyces sp. NPDC002057 TaxID=3154664 RepID=UPI003321E42D